MYLLMCVCLYAHVCVCLLVCLCIRVCVCMFVLVCGLVYLCVLVFVCSGVRLCIYVLLQICFLHSSEICPLSYPKPTMSSLYLYIALPVLSTETLPVAKSGRREGMRNTPNGYLLWLIFIITITGLKIT